MTRELLAKIVLLKQKINDVQKAPLYQKANRAEACIQDAVFVIEEMATELVRLEEILDELVTNSTGLTELNLEGAEIG